MFFCLYADKRRRNLVPTCSGGATRKATGNGVAVALVGMLILVSVYQILCENVH